MNDAEGTLLFVYNADSGLFNTVTDIAHKIFSPDTYQCDLCALTHGYFTVREAWQGFIESLGVPCEFLHRDQLGAIAGIDATQLPAVYRRSEGVWQLCLGAAEIAACDDLEALQERIRQGCAGGGEEKNT
jgi:hypothetical protein